MDEKYNGEAMLSLKLNEMERRADTKAAAAISRKYEELKRKNQGLLDELKDESENMRNLWNWYYYLAGDFKQVQLQYESMKEELEDYRIAWEDPQLKKAILETQLSRMGELKNPDVGKQNEIKSTGREEYHDTEDANGHACIDADDVSVLGLFSRSLPVNRKVVTTLLSQAQLLVNTKSVSAKELMRRNQSFLSILNHTVRNKCRLLGRYEKLRENFQVLKKQHEISEVKLNWYKNQLRLENVSLEDKLSETKICKLENLHVGKQNGIMSTSGKGCDDTEDAKNHARSGAGLFSHSLFANGVITHESQVQTTEQSQSDADTTTSTVKLGAAGAAARIKC